MAQQNPFSQQHIEESAYAKPDGLLDQLNLPPGLIKFLRRNQRTIWICVAVVAFVVTVVSLYGSYRTYRINKANAALHSALIAEEAVREQKLKDVASDFKGTGAETWSKVELALYAAENGKVDDAIAQLAALKTEIDKDNPLRPLLLNKLAGLYENSAKENKAIEVYKELMEIQGFAKEASFQLGRIYEQQGNKEQAKAMYEKYLAENVGDGGQAGQAADPLTNLVNSRLNRLAR